MTNIARDLIMNLLIFPPYMSCDEIVEQEAGSAIPGKNYARWTQKLHFTLFLHHVNGL